MTTIEIMYFLFYVLLAIYSSFTDIKKGIIGNRTILINLSMSVLLGITYYSINSYLLKSLLINETIIIFIAFFLFKIGIWGGGDSKLLICLSLLFPAKYYLNNLSWAPFIYVLIISFSISFIYLIIESITKCINDKICLKLPSIKNYLNFKTLKDVAVVYMFFYSLDSILYFALDLMQIEDLNIIIQFFNIMIILCFNPCKIGNNNCIYVLMFIFFFIFFISIRYLEFKTSFISTILIMLISLIKNFASQFNYSKIEAENLKVGMILSRYSTMLMTNSRIKNLPTSLEENMNSRLTQNQVDACKKWSKSEKGQKELIIVKKIPYAIFISISALIYMVMCLFINL